MLSRKQWWRWRLGGGVWGVSRLAPVSFGGFASIAAALFDNRGAVVGAIGLAGPVERLLPDGPAAESVAAVKEAARGLSRELGAGRQALPGAGA